MSESKTTWEWEESYNASQLKIYLTYISIQTAKRLLKLSLFLILPSHQTWSHWIQIYGKI